MATRSIRVDMRSIVDEECHGDVQDIGEAIERPSLAKAFMRTGNIAKSSPVRAAPCYLP
jgi:hypothetical protein